MKVTFKFKSIGVNKQNASGEFVFGDVNNAQRFAKYLLLQPGFFDVKIIN